MGSGDHALVFLHGFATDGSFRQVQRPLFASHSIVIDLPGHGDSDDSGREYSQEFFARAVNAVLEQEEILKAIFIGEGTVGSCSWKIQNASVALW